MYFLFDTFGYSLNILQNILKLYDITALDGLFLQVAIVIIFPFIQTIGIVILKSSTDPLSKISALYYLRIVSIN